MMLKVGRGWSPGRIPDGTAFWGLGFALLGVVAVSLSSPAHANPQGGQVAAGQASITSSGNTLNINQSTDKAVIDWRSFNIAADELTAFHQPSSSSRTLNRINDANPSQILGTLAANGQVILVNPNGVFFGPNSKVDVSGLIASTADIANSDFMAGKLTFSQPGNPHAAIINQGTITAQEAGLVGFVAPFVENNGVITAKLGQVTLASGDSFTLDMAGDHLIEVAVSGGVAQQLAGNTGRIAADGGTVMLTAAAGRQLVDGVVSNSGAIEANSIGGQNGHIVLYAEGSNAVQNNDAALKGQRSGDSTVLVSGTIDASGYGAGQKGGTVQVLGDQVGLLNGSVIDVNGDVGGGMVQAGGDFHGQSTTPTAWATVMQSGAAIKAAALNNGNGGDVTVWADHYTNFAGSISAHGGAYGGNGGFVETSGQQVLQAFGGVDARSPWGKAGTWLLDPADVTIATAANSNETGDPNFTPSGTASVINTTTIQNDLNAGTNVSVTTGGDAFAGNGDITVANGIAKSAGSDATLTLSAYRDILVNAPISSTSGKLNMLFQADNHANSSGYIDIAAALTSNGGNITMGGGSGVISAGSGYAVGNAGQATGVGIGAVVNAGGGNIIANGHGYDNAGGSNNYGVYLDNGGFTTTSGNVSVYGMGGNGLSDNHGVYLSGSGSQIATASGSITVTGIGGTAADTSGYISDYGVYLDQGTGISSSGTGAGVGSITVTGTAASAYGYSHGVALLNGSAISGNAADIRVNGTAFDFISYGTVIQLGSSITSGGAGNITISGFSSGVDGTGIETAAGPNVIGGASATGNITLVADILGFFSTTPIQTAGNVTIKPYTADTSIGVAGGAGTLQVTSGILDAIAAGGITIGNTSDSGAMDVGTYAWNAPLTLLSGSGNLAIDGAQAMGSNRFLADTVSGDIAIGSLGRVMSSASGTPLTLATSSGDFLNNNGASALSAPNGRWLIYSSAPFTDHFRGLAANFARFGCAYGGPCPGIPGAGNGLLYSSMLPDTVSKGFSDPAIGLQGFPTQFHPVGTMGLTDLITMNTRVAADQASPFLLDAGQ